MNIQWTRKDLKEAKKERDSLPIHEQEEAHMYVEFVRSAIIQQNKERSNTHAIN